MDTKRLTRSHCFFCCQDGEDGKPETIKHQPWCSHSLGTITYPDEFILRSVL